MRLAILLALAFAGCSGSGDDQPPIDTGPLPACTGATYESCTDNAQCTSQQCRLFNGDGIQICTQNCDANNPCPDFMGQAVTCNAMGRCKSPGQTMCTR